MNDPFELAVEHVAWCIRDDQRPIEVFKALGIAPPILNDRRPNWNDVIWACAQIASERIWTTQVTVTIAPPFKAPIKRAA